MVRITAWVRIEVSVRIRVRLGFSLDIREIRDVGTIYKFGGVWGGGVGWWGVWGANKGDRCMGMLPLKWLKTFLNFINHPENKNSDYINRKKHNSKYYRI